MKGKQLGLLLGLLIVLGGAGLLIQHNRNSATDTSGGETGVKLLGDNFPINDVARINIKQGTNELNLVRKEGMWRVQERNDYRANFSMIGDFLIKAADLKIVESEPIGPEDVQRLKLTVSPGTNSGVSLSLQDKDGKVIKALILGVYHTRKSFQKSPMGGDESFRDGRYVALAGDTQKVLLVGDSLETIEPKPEQWLNKDFFKIELPKDLAVTYADASNSWKIIRETENGGWKLANATTNESVDSNKLNGLTGPLASLSFDDVMAPSTKPSETGLDKPTVLAVDTFDDFSYTVKIGSKTSESYPITVTVSANLPKERPEVKDEKPEDKTKADKAWADRKQALEDKLKQAQSFENWIYLVPAWSLDSTLKERKDLMEEKKEEPKPADQPGPAADANAATNASAPADPTKETK